MQHRQHFFLAFHQLTEPASGCLTVHLQKNSRDRVDIHKYTRESNCATACKHGWLRGSHRPFRPAIVTSKKAGAGVMASAPANEKPAWRRALIPASELVDDPHPRDELALR